MNRESRKSKSQQAQAPVQSGPVKADLKSERVQQRLRELQSWKLVNDGLRQVRKFVNPGDAEAWVGFVIQLAGSHRQPVTVGLAGKKVEVTLTGHPARGFVQGGITNPVIDLAEALA